MTIDRQLILSYFVAPFCCCQMQHFGHFKAPSCLFVSNVTSADVGLTTALGKGQFYNVFGQRHKCTTIYQNYTMDRLDSGFKRALSDFSKYLLRQYADNVLPYP